MTLQHFLKNRNVALTLLNGHGEAIYLGDAITIKPQKERYYLRFNGTANESISPFTKAILHSGRTIFSILDIIPMRVNGTTSIDLVY